MVEIFRCRWYLQAYKGAGQHFLIDDYSDPLTVVNAEKVQEDSWQDLYTGWQDLSYWILWHCRASSECPGTLLLIWIQFLPGSFLHLFHICSPWGPGSWTTSIPVPCVYSIGFSRWPWGLGSIGTNFVIVVVLVWMDGFEVLPKPLGHMEPINTIDVWEKSFPSFKWTGTWMDCSLSLVNVVQHLHVPSNLKGLYRVSILLTGFISAWGLGSTSTISPTF